MDLAPFISSIQYTVYSIQYTVYKSFEISFTPKQYFFRVHSPINGIGSPTWEFRIKIRKLWSHPPTAADTFPETSSKFAPENGGFQGRNLQTSRGLEFRCENVSFREGTFTETNSKQKHLKVGEKNAPKGKGDRIPIPSIFWGKHNTNIKIIRISN